VLRPLLFACSSDSRPSFQGVNHPFFLQRQNQANKEENFKIIKTEQRLMQVLARSKSRQKPNIKLFHRTRGSSAIPHSQENFSLKK
jgi:hypothetical protein